MPGVSKLKTDIIDGQKAKEYTYCHKIKKISEFYPSSSRSLYNVTSKCKECFRIVNKAKYDTDKEGYSKKSSIRQMRSKYNMSPEDYANMYNFQEGKCLICKQPNEQLVIDHNHSTNEVRGLLCPSYNFGLGFFKDNIDLLYEAINYLIGLR